MRRLDLRSTKTRLDTEIRRLREENKALVDARRALEKSLEAETEKAAAEEDRLNEEVVQLQTKLRQQSESHELTSARRTIRELERQIDDYETKLAVSQFHAPGANGEGASELSILHRDLTSARRKEREFLQREALATGRCQILEASNQRSRAQDPRSRNRPNNGITLVSRWFRAEDRGLGASASAGSCA